MARPARTSEASRRERPRRLPAGQSTGDDAHPAVARLLHDRQAVRRQSHRRRGPRADQWRCSRHRG